jgi:hypothetical protein
MTFEDAENLGSALRQRHFSSPNGAISLGEVQQDHLVDATIEASDLSSRSNLVQIPSKHHVA